MIPFEITLEELPDEARQIAEVIGIDALLRLSARMGGEQIYIPLPGRLTAVARNRAIRAEFNGRNYNELAVKYNLTVRWIRAIVSGQAQSGDMDEDDNPRRPRQQKLFF